MSRQALEWLNSRGGNVSGKTAISAGHQEGLERARVGGLVRLDYVGATSHYILTDAGRKMVGR